MATQVILSDENCTGHAEAIFFVFLALGYVDLLNLELRTWKDAGLEEGADDEQVWRFCQENRHILLTGNRTAKDGALSLEIVMQQYVTSDSLPVHTIGDLERVLRDRRYCERCAERLAEIIFDLSAYRGIPRVYLT